MIGGTNKNNKLIYIAILIVGVIIGLFVFSKAKTSNYTSSNINNYTQGRTFTSTTLKFTVKVPANFTTEEKLTSLLLMSNTGEIIISRVSTNFDNIDAYLGDLSQKNHFTFQPLEKISYQNQILSKTRLSFQGSEYKIEYFVYVNNWVYSLSTSSPALYGDLDQIAKSFKYTP